MNRNCFEGGLTRHTPPRRLNRRGTASVELALCLPVLVLIALGAVEGASLIFLKQALVQSAYEGVKTAVRRDSTASEVEAATRAVLAGRTLDNARVEINPARLDQARRGELIRIRVTAPGDANSLLPFGPFRDREISATAVMVKE